MNRARPQWHRAVAASWPKWIPCHSCSNLFPNEFAIAALERIPHLYPVQPILDRLPRRAIGIAAGLQLRQRHSQSGLLAALILSSGNRMARQFTTPPALLP